MQEVLKAVELPVVSPTLCKKSYDDQTDMVITDKMFCAYEEGKDACQVRDEIFTLFRATFERFCISSNIR